MRYPNMAPTQLTLCATRIWRLHSSCYALPEYGAYMTLGFHSSIPIKATPKATPKAILTAIPKATPTTTTTTTLTAATTTTLTAAKRTTLTETPRGLFTSDPVQTQHDTPHEPKTAYKPTTKDATASDKTEEEDNTADPPYKDTTVDLHFLQSDTLPQRVHQSYDRDSIPKAALSQQAQSNKKDLILVGDYPVLRIISKDNNGGVTVTAPLSNLSNDSNEDTNGCDSRAQGRRTVPDQRQNSNLETTNNDDDPSGWTVVTRKKHKLPNKSARQWKTQESPLTIHARKLRQQQKCFKCLRKGHVKAVCANPRRCLHCNTPGHIIKNCPAFITRRPRDARRSNPSYKSDPNVPLKDHTFPNSTIPKIPHRPSKPSDTTNKPPISPELNTKNMNPVDPYAAPRDWQTMPLTCPADLWERRPNSLNVYLAPREGLAPANHFLECAAFIFAGPGRMDPDLKQRIAACMARQFRRDPRDFPVYTIHEDFGDVLLLFPDADMAESAINQGTFYVGHNITINLHPYSPALQMAFNPLGGRVRIKVYGLPMQHWNRADLTTLVSGFGYPLRFAPYITNGNYEYLTMLVATKDAAHVPFNLDLSVNPYQKDVRVDIDGWIHHEFPPPPNQGSDHSGGRRRGQRRGNPGGGPSSQNRTPPVGIRARANGHFRGYGDGRDTSSAGSNWTRPMNEWVDELREKLIAAGILSEGALGEQRTHAKDLPILNGTSVIEENPAQIVISQSNARLWASSGVPTFNVIILGPDTESLWGSGVNGSQSPVIFMMEGPPKTNSKERLVEILEEEGNITGSEQDFQGTGPLLTGSENGTEDGNITGPEQDLRLDIEGTGPLATGPHNIVPTGLMENGLCGGDKTTVKETDDPTHPPGYPIRVYGPNELFEKGNGEHVTNTLDQGQARRTKTTPASLEVRSPRLQKKYAAGRTRYGSDKKKMGKKGGKATLVQEEYLQSLNPLSFEQAEMVVKMAGITFSGKMEDEVAKVVMG
ncbi:Gag-Pol polyprotein [Carex littledalei]|uniref:Gag-Pol polyprotein n=1 Tax=Carex littledalei TaxID=544730 RepID=A0A833R5T2_9POAL|nr:Gag-Pol polyprotein [Carex littledalei]